MADLFSGLDAMNKKYGESKAGVLPLKQAVQLREAEDQAKQKKPHAPLGEAIGAVQVKGPIGTIDRFLHDRQYKDDPSFLISKEEVDNWAKEGIRPDQYQVLSRAVSADHLSYLKQIARENQNADDTLSTYGIAGNIGLSLTDPVGTGVGLLSGGIGYSAKLGRLANAVRSGSVAAAQTFAMDTAAGQFDPTRQDWAENAKNAGIAFAFAGALGARKGLDFDPKRPLIDTSESGITLDKVKSHVHGDDSLSAARVKGSEEPDPTPGVMPLRNEGDHYLDFKDAARDNADLRSITTKGRISLSAQGDRMKAPTLREAFKRLYREGVGYNDRNAAIEESAVEHSQRALSVLETQWRAAANAQWQDAVAERTGGSISSWFKSRVDFAGRKAFNEEIGRAVRGDTDVSPQATKAASRIHEVIANITQHAKDNGLDEFDFVKPRPNYLPRYWSVSGFRKVFGEMGLHEDDVIDKLLVPSMRKEWEANLSAAAAKTGAGVQEIDPDTIRGVAKAWLKRAQAAHDDVNADAGLRPLALHDVDEVAALLREGGVPDAQAASLLTRLKENVEQAGQHDRTKHRIDMDENFQAQIPDDAGNLQTVKVSDLLENDIEDVMSRFTRDITGWAAMKAKFDIANQSQLIKFRDNLMQDARKFGENKAKVERMLDIGFNSVLHRSTERDPTSAISRFGHFFRQTQFARVMNQSGLAQWGDFGPAIAYAGVNNFLKAGYEFTTSMGRFIRRDEGGRLLDAEARAMEEVFGVGTEWMRHPPFMRFDGDSLLPPTFGDSKIAQVVDNVNNGAAYISSVLSLLAPITKAQKIIAGRSMVLRMIEMANQEKPLDAAMTRRLRQWGLGEKAQTDLFNALKGKKGLADIDPSAVSFNTRESMAHFLKRATDHMILEPDVADTHQMLHNPVGKLILQFRRFTLASHERHFMNAGANYDDYRTYMMLAWSTAIAYAGWTTRNYVNTIGDPERRAKIMTPENAVKGSINQGAYSGFIPMMADALWTDVARNGTVFTDKENIPEWARNGIFANSSGRTTELENGIKGIPVVDYASKLYQTPNLLAAMMSPNAEVKEKDLRNFASMFYFQNMTGVQNIKNWLIKQAANNKGDNFDNAAEAQVLQSNPAQPDNHTSEFTDWLQSNH